jgi:hypothetical protein
MTVFHDRRTASYAELTGNRGDYMVTTVPGFSNASAQERNQYLNKLGYSGGEVPPMSASRTKYPLDQTVSVVNMR